MNKYEELSKFILEKIGGKENIISLTHCITRLRFRLKDEKLADDEALKARKDIVTIMHSAGQYQVVIGNHVNQVYEDFCKVAGITDENDGSDNEEANIGFFNKVMEVISGCFQPILGVLCASGIIKGLVALLQFILGAEFTATGTYIVLNAVGDGMFYFLPILLGYSASRKFKLDPMIGMVIGAILVYPTIQTDAIAALGEAIGNIPLLGSYHKTFLGIPFVSGSYTQTVVPVVIIVLIASKFEKLFKRIIPDVIKKFIVPFLVLLISVPLGLLLIGPVVSLLTNLLSSSYTVLFEFSPMLTGLLIGFFWMILVIFGLHWALVPIFMLNITQLGYDTILVALFGHSFALMGALIAMYIKQRDKEAKAMVIPAIISALFGVTEPGIYGFTLPERRPFIFACTASAAAGAIFTAIGGKCYIMGGLGIFGVVNHISPQGDATGMYLSFVSIAISLVIAFVLTYFFWNYKDNIVADKSGVKETDEKGVMDKIVVNSPMKGDIIKLEDVEDEAFSAGVLGKGVGIIPKDGAVYAPFDGTVVTVFPTKHALGLISDTGAELLIHIGINTVNLEGRGFISHVENGSKVKQGQLLLEVDLDLLKKEGYNIQTPVLITNVGDFIDVIETDKKNIDKNDVILTGVFAK